MQPQKSCSRRWKNSSNKFFVYAMARLGKGQWLVLRSTEQLHAEMNLLRNKTFRKKIGRVKEIRIVRARITRNGAIEISLARPCRHCSLSLRHYAKKCKRVCGRTPRLRYSKENGQMSDPESMIHLPEGSVLSSGNRRIYNSRLN